MSIEGQGLFFTIYFPGFVCFVIYLAKISGERLQDHWSSGFFFEISLLIEELFNVLVLSLNKTFLVSIAFVYLILLLILDLFTMTFNGYEI